MTTKVEISTKLLVTVDREALAMDYGLDPRDASLHAELAEMVGNDAWVVPDCGHPLAELGATVRVDLDHAWQRARTQDHERFAAVKLFLIAEIDPDLVRERYGVEAAHAVPHWLITYLSQTSLIRDHSGTVVPLIPGR